MYGSKPITYNQTCVNSECKRTSKHTCIDNIQLHSYRLITITN